MFACRSWILEESCIGELYEAVIATGVGADRKDQGSDMSPVITGPEIYEFMFSYFGYKNGFVGDDEYHMHLCSCYFSMTLNQYLPLVQASQFGVCLWPRRAVPFPKWMGLCLWPLAAFTP